MYKAVWFMKLSSDINTTADMIMNNNELVSVACMQRLAINPLLNC